MHQEQRREWFALLIKPILLAFFLVSLLFVYKWLSAANLSNVLSLQLNLPWLLAAVLTQGIATAFFVFVWALNLKIHFSRNLGLGNIVSMIGYNSIGKYTPGKVLGLVARGAALYNLTLNKSLVMQATLIEQLAIVHSGAMLMAISWAIMQGSGLLLSATLALGAGSVLVATLSRDLLFRSLNFVLRRGTPVLLPDTKFARCYLAIFPLLLLQWAVSASALLAIVQAFELTADVSLSDSMWITSAAYLAGFLAFFTLAGLGVREGVMAGLLASEVGVDIAIYISIVHRLITLAYDVLLGVYSFVRTSTSSSTIKRGEHT